MTGIERPKKKLKAWPFLKDLRTGMADEALMAKYKLSPRQMERVLERLVDAGLLHELELYERTRLSDTMITKAFMETRPRSFQDRPVRRLESYSEADPQAEVEYTEVIDLTDNVVRR
ncbi:MAG: hypothetical protein FJ118_05995 [Deltaproteobacteria bacterium]|nr:hypothetical protein [Deltaproteobacteria bacterium]MBM4326701.1 hypothetical protein [Deltaproteobacteria bacterium]